MQTETSSKIVLIIYAETNLNGNTSIYLVKEDIQNNTYKSNSMYYKSCKRKPVKQECIVYHCAKVYVFRE